MKRKLKIFNNLFFASTPILAFLVLFNFNINLSYIYEESSHIILFITYLFFIVSEIKNLFNINSINYNIKYNIVIFIFNLLMIFSSIIYYLLSKINFSTLYFPIFKQNLILIFILFLLVLLYKFLVNDKKTVYNNLFFMLACVYIFNKIINDYLVGLFILVIFVIIYLICLKRKNSFIYIDEYNSLIKKYNYLFILYILLYEILIRAFLDIGTVINKLYIIISIIFMCLIVLCFIKNIKNKTLRRILYILYYLIIILTITLGLGLYIITYC